jgi:hypothetical protein
VLVGLVPALPDGVKANLDAAYTASLATIPGGWRKNAGISIGATVAARMLANRATDGRYVPYSFTPGTGVGQWRPELPMFVSDPFAWVSNVKPFAIGRASRFRTAGPLDIHSAAYARELNEVKSVGSSTSTSPNGSTDRARDVLHGQPDPMLNKSLRDIVVRKGLSITRAARLFADDKRLRRRRTHRLLGRQGPLQLLAADHRRSGVPTWTGTPGRRFRPTGYPSCRRRRTRIIRRATTA